MTLRPEMSSDDADRLPPGRLKRANSEKTPAASAWKTDKERSHDWATRLPRSSTALATGKPNSGRYRVCLKAHTPEDLSNSAEPFRIERSPEIATGVVQPDGSVTLCVG